MQITSEISYHLAKVKKDWQYQVLEMMWNKGNTHALLGQREKTDKIALENNVSMSSMVA